MVGGEALKVIVANTGEDTLTYIDLKNRGVIETIELKNNGNKGPFFGPYDMVANGKGYIYISNIYDNSIIKLDIKNRKVIDVLHVGSYPTCIKYFQNHLYVTNSDSNSISIIDERNFSLIENISVGEKPIDIEIDEKEMKIYVANSNESSINVIDLISKSNNTIRLDNNPIKIIIEGKYLYILFTINNDTINNSNISIINLKTYEKQNLINLEGIFSTMLKINSSEIIFLTNIDKGYLYRMDIEKKNLLSKTYLTGMPNKLDWDGQNLLFITNILTDTLTLFDTNENRIIKNIKVGQEPNGILILD